MGEYGVSEYGVGTYSDDPIVDLTEPNTINPVYKVYVTTENSGAYEILNSESFETGLGGWVNSADDDKEWTRLTGPTGSANTGPSAASDGSYYVYLETSSGVTGDEAWLEYDMGSVQSGYVSFAYHMYGISMGSLRLEGWDGSAWSTIWSLSGNQGDSWFTATTPDTDFSGYSKLRFVGVRGTSYTGDVAIDNITIYTETPTIEITDFVSGDVSISTSDTLSLANLTLSNTNGQYNDIISYGDIIDVFVYDDTTSSHYYDLENGLTAFYLCDDDTSATVLVDSEGLYNGTIVDGEYVDTLSVSGKSLYFNGTTTDVTLSNLNKAQQDSFSVNLNAKAFDTGYQFYLTTNDGMGNYYLRLLDSTSSLIAFYTDGEIIRVLDVDSEDNVYVASGQNVKKLHLDGTTFVEDWSFARFTSTERGYVGALTAGETTLHVGGTEGTFINVNTSTGGLNGTVSGLHGTDTITKVLNGPSRVYDGPNGNLPYTIYTCSTDNTVKQLDNFADTVWTYSGHLADAAGVRDIALSSEGHLYTAGMDGSVRVLDETGALLSTNFIGDDVYALAFDADDNLFISYYADSAYQFKKFDKSFSVLAEVADTHGPGEISVALDNTIYVSGLGTGTSTTSRKYNNSLELLNTYSAMGINSDVHASMTRTDFPEKQVIFKRGTNSPRISFSGRRSIEFVLNASTTYTYEFDEDVYMFDFVNIGVSYSNGVYKLFVDGKYVQEVAAPIVAGDLATKLGEGEGAISFFNGYMDNIGVWSSRALLSEEHFYLSNNRSALSPYEFTTRSFFGDNQFQSRIHRGVIEAIDYRYGEADGFTLSINSKSFPELTDTVFSELFANETANLAIDRILEQYRTYRPIVFSYWENNGWYTTSYDSTTGISSWNVKPVDFPEKQDNLIVATYQDERGWKAIKDICDRVGLDVWLEYDDINTTWVVRTVKKNEYALSSRETHQWRMDDKTYGIDTSTSVSVLLDNDYIERNLIDYVFELELSDLPQNIKDEVEDYPVYVQSTGNGNGKYINNGASASSITTFPMAGIGTDSFIDSKGNYYAVDVTRIRKYNFDLSYEENLASTTGDYWNAIDPSVQSYSITATLDGEEIFIGCDGGEVLKYNSNGEELWSITPHASLVSALATDNKGFLYTASTDNTVKKINVRSKEVVWTYSGFVNDVMDVKVDSAGYVYACDFGGVVKRLTSAGVQDWSYTIASTQCYSLALDSSNNVIVGCASGTLVKLTSAGALTFNLATVGGSSINHDVDVDVNDFIYIMKWDNTIVCCNTSGTVQWSQSTSAESTGGYALSVDKREYRNFEVYSVKETDVLFDKEIVTLTKPLAGKVKIRIPFLDYDYENRLVFRVDNKGLKDAKNSEVWTTDYNAVWHFESFGDYAYDSLKDSSQYDLSLVDETTHYISEYFNDTTTYDTASGGITLLKTYYAGVDFFMDTVSKVIFNSYTNHTSVKVLAAFTFYYEDGTSGFIQYTSPSSGNLNQRFNTVLNPNPEKTVTRIEFRLGTQDAGTSRAYVNNLNFYGAKERPTDSLHIDVDFELNTVTGRQSIVGATEQSYYDVYYGNVETPNSFELYTSGTNLLLDLYPSHEFIVLPNDDVTEYFNTVTSDYATLSTYSDISCFFHTHTTYIRSENLGATVSVRAKYTYSDGTIDYSNVQSTNNTTFAIKSFNNPNVSKRVIKLEVQGKTSSPSYRVRIYNTQFSEVFGYGLSTFSLGTLEASTAYNVVVNYKDSFIYTYINGVLVKILNNTGIINSGYGYALGANGPSDTTDVIDGTISRAIIGRGLSRYAVETNLLSRYQTGFYDLYNGDILFDSVGNSHGIIDTGKTTSSRGKIGRALKTDSTTNTEKLYVPVSDDDFVNGPFTTTMWVKPIGSTSSTASIIERDNWSVDLSESYEGLLSVGDVYASTDFNTDTIQFSHTVASGDDRLLIVGLSYRNASPTLTVTYNGTPMTLLASEGYNDVSTRVYYLKNPVIGTYDIEISSTSDLFRPAYGAYTLYNVDQDSTFNAVSSIGNINTSLSRNITSTTSSVVLDFLALLDHSSGLTTTAGQTTLWSSSNYGSEPVRGYAGYKMGENSSTNVAYTFGSAYYYAHIGVSVNLVGDAIYRPSFTVTTNTGDKTVTSGVNISVDDWSFLECSYNPYNTLSSNDGVISIRNVPNVAFADGDYQELNLAGSVISASANTNMIFGSNSSIVFDDVRLFRSVLSNTESGRLYSNSFGTETPLSNTFLDVIQSKNLINVNEASVDTSDVYNRVIVYGNTISENIINVYTAENKELANDLWYKDKVVNDDTLTDYDSIRQVADRELKVSSQITRNALVEAIGTPLLKPSSNVTINVPNCNLSGVYRVQEITHNLGEQFTTTIALSRRIDDFRDIFVNKINFDDFVSPTSNFNNMKYSVRAMFTESPAVVRLANTEIVSGVVRLESTATEGTVTSDIITVRDAVSYCEFRRYENQFTENDVYEVTNDGGVTWEEIDRVSGVIHEFVKPGKRLGFRITMNRDSTSDTSPAYESVVALFK